MKVKLWTRLGTGNLVFLATVVSSCYHPPDVLVWRGRFFVPEGRLNRWTSYVEVIGSVVTEEAQNDCV